MHGRRHVNLLQEAIGIQWMAIVMMMGGFSGMLAFFSIIMMVTYNPLVMMVRDDGMRYQEEIPERKHAYDYPAQEHSAKI